MRCKIIPAVLIMASIFGCRVRTESTSQGMSGFTVGNGDKKGGGDTILCRADADLKAKGGVYLEGIFALDYYLTANSDELADEPHLATFEQYRDRLNVALSAKSPILAKKFMEFAALLENQNPALSRIWEPSQYALLPLPDEGIEQLPFPNCLVDGKPDLQQIVVRRSRDDAPGRVSYLYDKNRFGLLRTQSPLQFSFLVTHEWLRDLTDDPSIIRYLNRLFHSKRFDALVPAAFEKLLTDKGIDLSEAGYLLPVGPRDRELARRFSQSPLCDYDRHIAKDFLTNDLAMSLTPGDEGTLHLTVSGLPDGADQICGMAIVYRYSYEKDGPKAFDVLLRRGPMTFQQTIDAALASKNQNAAFVLCDDILCAGKNGELKNVMINQQFQAGTWDLIIRNRSDDQTLKISAPQLILVPMRSH